jgi:integrase
MPRKCYMSWEGAPKYRWVKMHEGLRYRVSCEQLGAMVYTQEATVAMANAWWEKKLAELRGPSPVARVIQAVEEVPIEKLRQMMERGDALRQILAELPFVKTELGREEVARIVGEPVADQAEAVAKLGSVVAKVTDHAETPIDRTFEHHAERFLNFVRGKPKSFKEIRDLVLSLYDATGLSKGMAVTELNEEKVEGIFLWLKKSDLSAGAKKKRWGFFKRLVRYFWENNLIPLPRNLDSRSMRFVVTTKAVKTWPLSDVRECLAGLKPRMRLYALLGLNCGMTNVDIARLRKDQVNLMNGRLTRKRVKTEAHELVPVVDYSLWPETLQLLTLCWSKHPELTVTSVKGTCLLETRLEGDAFKEKDLIGLMWQRTKPKPKIPLKGFRSISATLLESHESYGRYKGHFLGHSPKSIADRHYTAPSGELFDCIVAWLHDQIFPREG